MTTIVLFLLLCSVRDFDLPGGSVQQQDACDFSEYHPIRISDYKVPVKKSVKPKFPKEAVEAKIGGRVIVKVLIDLEGNVVRACSSNEHQLLKQAAIEAVQQWKFIRNCKSCLGQKTTYTEEFIVFNFDLNAATKPSKAKSSVVVR